MFKISRISWKNGRSIRLGRREINIAFDFPQNHERMEEEQLKKIQKKWQKISKKLEEWKKQ